MELNQQGTVRIETERLVLRKLVIEDAQSLFNNIINDPKVGETFMIPYFEEFSQSETLIKGLINRGEGSNSFLWGVELKQTKEIIGIITSPEQNDAWKSIEIGYAFGSKFWNCGYATEAVKPVIDYFLNVVGYHRLTAGFFVGNVASGKVMAKCGMIYEGSRHDDVYYKGQYLSTENYYLIGKNR